MKKNTRAIDQRVDRTTRLAGGQGMFAAVQDPVDLFKRVVMANLLWEGNFYQDGVEIANTIKELIPQIDPDTLEQLVLDAKFIQKLRHVPLLIIREMARTSLHKGKVANLLSQVITRPDDLTEFLALYWSDGKQPISKQVKRGLALAFLKFNAYQFAKWSNDDKQISVKDVMFLVHPEPNNSQVEDIFRMIASNTLPTPDTWEVSLSAGEDKKKTWERLITQNKLGATAFLRNLRNMRMVNVDDQIIKDGLRSINPTWLLPVDYLKAFLAAPQHKDELESLMFRAFSNFKPLSGNTVFILDVSGSMGVEVSADSKISRLDIAMALLMVGVEMCENPIVYLTAGNDMTYEHQTWRFTTHHGFNWYKHINTFIQRITRGGIFTKQALDAVKYELSEEGTQVDRIIVISDSQDTDRAGSIPRPFGKHNYIIDIAAHTRGINYRGAWTAEITGWSDRFLHYIAALEGNILPQEN